MSKVWFDRLLFAVVYVLWPGYLVWDWGIKPIVKLARKGIGGEPAS